MSGLLASVAIVAGLLTVATPAQADGGTPQQNQAKYYAKLSARAASEGLPSPTATADAPTVQPYAAATSNPVNASAFTAGNLMSDAVFYAEGITPWTASQVQTFLNSQVPT
ncbi:MAG TPA: hypothetical protein VGI08_00655, partial [Diaminobutyricibacter sp.]